MQYGSDPLPGVLATFIQIFNMDITQLLALKDAEELKKRFAAVNPSSGESKHIPNMYALSTGPKAC